ncbi:MAG: hypothetical protein ACE5HQ_10780 [Gemmatimonadota bacterium]
MRLIPIMVAGLAVAGAGCSGDSATGVGGVPVSFDAARTQEDIQAVNRVFGSDVWQSFQAFGHSVTSAPASASGAAAAGLAVENLARLAPSEARRAAVDLTRLILSQAGGRVSASRVPRIPPGIRGTTFVLDPETRQYVPDPDRTGAPPNGLRFILYAVNPFTGEPVVTAEIGHADLTDEGDSLPDAVALRLRIVSEGTTFLDYTVQAGGSETGGALSVAGFVRDRETRLEFDIAVTTKSDPNGESADVSFHLMIPQRRFAADGTVAHVNGQTGQADRIELAVRVGEDTIGFTATQTETAVDATFTVNGRVFATLTGDPMNPEVLGADGRKLTREEARALNDIASLTDTVFRLLGQLLQPASSILGLGMMP